MKKTKKLAKHDIVRSSAAEYLTFVSATGEQGVELRYEDENIWLTQKMMAILYGVEVVNINQHIKTIFDDKELDRAPTIKKFLIVGQEGDRQVQREVLHYNLQMIVAVGFKINNDKAVQFRKWANYVVKEFTVKGYVMDDERLKNGGSVLTKKYFEEQLERIREIRLSERKFYQKITDIYATALDYDATAKVTQEFFARVQNKMHFAVHGQTAPQVILNRANASKTHMGLTIWQDAPKGKIKKSDTVVAKNYLTDNELQALGRIVSAYLDIAEDMAERNIPMTMQDWIDRLDLFIKATDRQLLQDAGQITRDIAEKHALAEFEKYRVIQDQIYTSDFDQWIAKQQDDK